MLRVERASDRLIQSRDVDSEINQAENVDSVRHRGILRLQTDEELLIRLILILSCVGRCQSLLIVFLGYL